MHVQRGLGSSDMDAITQNFMLNFGSNCKPTIKIQV